MTSLGCGVPGGVRKVRVCGIMDYIGWLACGASVGDGVVRAWDVSS